MKNVSLFFKIIFSVTLVTMIFMAIFSFENYDTLNKQLNILEDEKFTSIAKTVEPIISINHSLGLERGYEDAIKQLFKTNPEIIQVTLSDNTMHPFYEVKQENEISTKQLSEENLYTLKVEMYDKLLGARSGFITLQYTHSKYLHTIISKYNSFLMRMFFLYIGLIIILALLIYFSMKPLNELAKILSLYMPGDKLKIVPMNGKDEVAVINNSVIEMLKKIEKELEKRMQSEKELSHKSRLESMGEMIDNIAHQWRQPLMNINAIFMNIDRAYEIGRLDESCLEKNMQEATNLTAHMSQTIEDFRSFFRKDKEMESVDINTIVTYSFSLIGSVSKDITICFDKAENLNILVYKNELIQVIISIISNAVDVLKQREVKDKKIFVSLKEHPEVINIIIEDNGGGIASEHIGRIFEPYYSTKHQFGGSGLGLYICKMIIEEHMDGTIKVSNTEQGAKFDISLKKGLV